MVHQDPNDMKQYEPVIGMEIHVELKTNSKMFCGCKNDPFFARAPNIYTCPVCLGLPGALPVPNKKAVEWTVKLGLALGCTIPEWSQFDRKHYFYPDLPKGYQISQYDNPLAVHGTVKTRFGAVGIRRVHLEEDTAKLLHTTVDGQRVSLIDFNRSSVPLVEIVTEPDIRSGEHAKEFLKKLHQIIRYLDISDADMEKGSMRLEPNISVRAVDVKELPSYKVEIKNINSFNFVKKAIEYEVIRHTTILEEGKIPPQETRGWVGGKGVTVSQRTKEEANDYRYFPEPDTPPMRWNESQISKLKSQIPELPDEKKQRFMQAYALNIYDADLVTETRDKAEYFEESCRVAKTVDGEVTPKKIANWLINKKIAIDQVLPVQLVEEIRGKTRGSEISSEDLTIAIQTVIAENPKAVEDYKNGKQQALMFLVGQVIRITRNASASDQIRTLLESTLSR